MTTATLEKPAKVAMNGVDVPAFLATLGAVDGQRELARFSFRAEGNWISGTHSQARMGNFQGAGGEQQRDDGHMIHGDHPAVLCGRDQGATPVEMLLAALSACITAGIGNIASIRQVRLESVETVVEGNIDLLGILGLDNTVRNGFEGINIQVRIKGDTGAEDLEKIVHQSVARSAVFDVLTNGVPVTVSAQTA
ncbi:OsmC family protein [Novosphingobium pentaromativorans]|uniref:OsmC family protein n=1 Tax=Novosphingobium pentaromativorans US6-1 TaxID=1088721 RepID=G6EH42_9SPHN|nr:OsmC family protein [Novosphingobium pentaromativorans]AIT81979.1 osmotically inducible protein C [Novosphingobium pentaromativorans US6-1]EHJ59331.1 OsmC family protein [Novosphingobium pentaromativorans US6-1]